MTLIRRLSAAGLALAGALAGCGDSTDSEHQLPPSHTLEPAGRTIHWDASAAERHGISASDFAKSAGGVSATAGAPAPTGGAAASLHWTTPPGWTEKPPAQFRDANFLVAGDARAECYLTTLPGEAGGLAANINRWRSQLSLAPLEPDEVAALPRVSWLGGEAVSLDFEGTWSGMSGDQSGEDWRLVGLMQVGHDVSRFLKMVGPAQVIGGQLDSFRALAGSFHFAEPDADAEGMASGDMGSEGLDAGGMGAPAAGAAAAGATAAPAEDSQRTGSLAWRAPAGWRRGPEKPMRELTYFAGEGDRVECSVTLLGGSGGGLLANINRWCGQLGAAPLSEADLGGLEHLPMAGGDGVLVRIERGAGATAPAGQELMLGVVCLLPDRALFVKMTGPADAVDGQRGALIGFCRSLELLP